MACVRDAKQKIVWLAFFAVTRKSMKGGGNSNSAVWRKSVPWMYKKPRVSFLNFSNRLSTNPIKLLQFLSLFLIPFLLCRYWTSFYKEHTTQKAKCHCHSWRICTGTCTRHVHITDYNIIFYALRDIVTRGQHSGTAAAKLPDLPIPTTQEKKKPNGQELIRLFLPENGRHPTLRPLFAY